FMSYYNYKYDEVLEVNWFLFNDLLKSADVVKAEENFTNLMIADNHLLVESKDKMKYMKLYKDLENKIKMNAYVYKERVKSVKEIMGSLGGV
ncbi:MAG: hypothetical protein ACRC6E_12160, partial [Fusobacteriaceae bacterium]